VRKKLKKEGTGNDGREKIIFCKSGGCTAKLGAGVLEHILEKLPKGEKDPNLLVGYDSKDDASVYRLTAEDIQIHLFRKADDIQGCPHLSAHRIDGA